MGQTTGRAGALGTIWRWSLLAGLASVGLPPAFAQGADRWQPDFAFQVSYHLNLDGRGKVGLALEARYLYLDRPQFEARSVWRPRAGAGARLALAGLDELRLLVVPHLAATRPGNDWRDGQALDASVGLGYALGPQAGPIIEGVMTGDLGYVQSRVAYALGRDLSLGVGARVPGDAFIGPP